MPAGHVQDHQRGVGVVKEQHVDEPVVRLPGEVPEPDLTHNIRVVAGLWQRQPLNLHAVG